MTETVSTNGIAKITEPPVKTLRVKPGPKPVTERVQGTRTLEAAFGIFTNLKRMYHKMFCNHNVEDTTGPGCVNVLGLRLEAEDSEKNFQAYLDAHGWKIARDPKTGKLEPYCKEHNVPAKLEVVHFIEPWRI